MTASPALLMYVTKRLPKESQAVCASQHARGNPPTLLGVQVAPPSVLKLANNNVDVSSLATAKRLRGLVGLIAIDVSDWLPRLGLTSTLLPTAKPTSSSVRGSNASRRRGTGLRHTLRRH